MGLKNLSGRNRARRPDLQYPEMGALETLNYLGNQLVEPLSYMTPGVGDYKAHQDAVEKYREAARQLDRGNYGQALMYGAGGLGDDLTTVPAIGDLAMLGKGLGALATPLMTAYHGSPHRFPPTERNPLGEFDLSKIGTGEGAQAYGHGIYLAENPGVAKSYQVRRQNGKTFKAPIGGPFDDVEMLDSDPAHFYTVDLPDEHIEKMLDLDAPFSGQSKYVKSALAKTGIEYEPSDTGYSIYNKLVDMQVRRARQEMGYKAASANAQGVFGGARAEASRILNDAGIPGNKYYDGGSREAANGTRNFVLFDPSIASITGRK